jgi:transcriptional regulator with XRE-family HTH domain
MLDQALIKEILRIKEENGYTLYDLSKKLDIQVTTIERWLQTRRINKIYARLVRERLNIG